MATFGDQEVSLRIYQQIVARLVMPEDLPESVMEAATSPGQPRARYHEAINQLKKELILRAVDDTKGNLTEAARTLGLHPNYLHRLIRNMNLKSAVKSKSS